MKNWIHRGGAHQGTRTGCFKRKNAYNKLKRYSNIPIVVGFGINTPEKAKIVSKYADGVVVGSAIVNELDKTIDKKSNINNNVIRLVKKFSKAIKEARK